MFLIHISTLETSNLEENTMGPPKAIQTGLALRNSAGVNNLEGVGLPVNGKLKYFVQNGKLRL